MGNLIRIVQKPKVFRFLMNFWPPLVGAGIKVRHISEDFRKIVVSMSLTWYNRNYIGTHFGGSLFAMTDPFFMLMLVHILGKGYRVVDHAASINFVSPGMGRVTATFSITDEQIEAIKSATESGQKHFAEFKVDVLNSQDIKVATVEKRIYIRRRVPLQTKKANLISD